MKNLQLETCEEQLDPPIVSNKNPWEALGRPPGRWDASAMTTLTLGLRPRFAQQLVGFSQPRLVCPWASQASLAWPVHAAAGHLP